TTANMITSCSVRQTMLIISSPWGAQPVTCRMPSLGIVETLRPASQTRLTVAGGRLCWSHFSLSVRQQHHLAEHAASGRTVAGFVPPLPTVKTVSASCRTSAICDRAELPVHRMSTRFLSAMRYFLFCVRHHNVQRRFGRLLEITDLHPY